MVQRRRNLFVDLYVADAWQVRRPEQSRFTQTQSYPLRVFTPVARPPSRWHIRIAISPSTTRVMEAPATSSVSSSAAYLRVLSV